MLRMRLLVVGVMLTGLTLQGAAPPPLAVRGFTPRAAGPVRGRCWALIIGVNYKGHSDARLELKNAERDAQLVYDTLTTHYGFDPRRVVRLIGKDATAQAIDDHLKHKLVGGDTVQKDDCLLIYFAGHGGRGQDGSRREGLLYPHDVEMVNARPQGRYLRVHRDVVASLNNSPARHKLLILDCCHSGEVFAREARARGELDDRRDRNLLAQPCLQALASCRATEVAADGTDDHSPFTRALVDALRTLPLERDASAQLLPVTDVFREMRHRMRMRAPTEQSPDLRSLIAQDGEFLFLPQGGRDGFSRYATQVTDLQMLQATVPGEHGNWWFDEMPWFMPSVREYILSRAERSRSNLVARATSKQDLHRWAREAADKMPAGDGLARMRRNHLRLFLTTTRPRSPEARDRIERAIDELKRQQEHLTAGDLHFLAVLQHSQKSSRTLKTYKEALAKYAEQRKDKDSQRDRAMEALCQADLGWCLFESYQPVAAAEAFRRAREMFRDPPAPFLIFTLCCEADAWQQVDRWGDANKRLSHALDVAVPKADQHPLTAYVYRRVAWASMEQWRIAEAKRAFEESDRILKGRRDPEADIPRFHNRHGLAMALRFSGQTRAAARAYRATIRDVARKWSDLRDKTTQDSFPLSNLDEVRTQLLVRWINSQERLGDCNLFGPPGDRDLKEAVDDYRRAIRLCYQLPPAERQLMEIGLVYKLALALAMPSPVQDVGLARKYFAQATAMGDEDVCRSDEGPFRYHRALFGHVIAVYASGTASENAAARRQALADLRAAVGHIRKVATHNIHRDHLEFVLVAGKTLVEQRVEGDRFETTEDVELLLHFCRKALQHETGEATRYLRQYHDAAVRALLAQRPADVMTLLAVQRQATEGRLHVKDETAEPVLALYLLDGKCCLFLDLPRGASKVFTVDASRDELAAAGVAAAERRLKLPRDLLAELDRLGRQATLRVWWEDEVHNLPLSRHNVGLAGAATVVRGEFPFVLPAGLRVEYRSMTPAASARVVSAP